MSKVILRRRKRLSAVASLLALIAMGSGCASPASDWKSATQTNSIEAYEAYARKYPSGEFTAEALQRLQEMRWRRAQSSGTVALYRQLLEQYATGPLAPAAQANIDMADSFSVEPLKVSTEERAGCVKSGAEVLLRIRAVKPSGAVATLSPLTMQAESVTGQWIEPRAFSIVGSVNIGLDDNVLSTSCMMDGGPVNFFKFDVIRSKAPPVSTEPLSALSLSFRENGSLRMRVLFEVGADQLVAMRAFGTTVRLSSR